MNSSDNSNEANKVGYKSPPKDKQFKKGQSGNPKGRPPTKMLHTVVESVLNELVTISTSDGKQVTMTRKEAVIKQLIQGSMAGKAPATKNLIYLLRSLTHITPM